MNTDRSSYKSVVEPEDNPIISNKNILSKIDQQENELPYQNHNF